MDPSTPHTPHPVSLSLQLVTATSVNMDTQATLSPDHFV